MPFFDLSKKSQRSPADIMVRFCWFSFLFDFPIVSENAKKTTNDTFWGKYAILKHYKIVFAWT